MPEQSAGHAAVAAWRRTRQLLFPVRPGRWLAVYLGSIGGPGRGDPAAEELRRLRPYYRGTRLMTQAGIVLILAAFVVPFSVVFVGMEGFGVVLIAYAAIFVAASLLGMAVQSALDAIFALQHERQLTFGRALGEYAGIAREQKDLAWGYMAIKMTVDFSLSTLALSLFLPALLGMMALMVFIMNEAQAGADWMHGATLGLAAIAVLALLGFLGVLLITVPATAFYGYYTEEALRMMRE